MLVAERLPPTLDLQEAGSVLAVPESGIKQIVGFNFHRGMLAAPRWNQVMICMLSVVSMPDA